MWLGGGPATVSIVAIAATIATATATATAFAGAALSKQWHFDDTMLSTLPAFVIAHAPLVWLHSEETYLPGSIEQYLLNFVVGTRTANSSEPLTPASLRSAGERLRRAEGHTGNAANEAAPLALQARSQWQHDPSWVTGKPGGLPNLWTGRADSAVATVIVVDKPGNVTDAFWFYFYPFNEGPYVMGDGPFGNHLGDWEHSLVRFVNGKPTVFWASAHGGGGAYYYPPAGNTAFAAPHADPGRPALLAGRGTHANYASAGQHPRDAPWHILNDYTERGHLWDPALNFVAYRADLSDLVVSPANGSEPGRELKWGDWLLYDGLWGNWQLPSSDVRQKWSPWQWRVVDGPMGPVDKNLGRTKPCERHKWWNLAHACLVRHRPTPAEGLDANDARACPILTRHLPAVLHPIVARFTKHGYLCWLLDELWG